ncbi:MAG: VCBS repeat-containing protein, partial [Ferruginibacter sp.]
PDDDYRLKTTGTIDNFDLYRSKIKAGLYHQYVRNCLQLNNGKNNFIDIANYSGVAATDWSWGALIFDMDNDGWNDLYVCNGVNRDVTNLDFTDFFANEVNQKMVMSGEKKSVDKILQQIPRTPLPNKVYRNNKDLHFSDIGKDWGLAEPTFSNGAAYADLDNDGDLDLVVCNQNQPAFIYKNKSREINRNNFISFTLKGKDKNPFAIGSKLQVFSNSEIYTRELFPSRGFQSSVDYKIVFGLGKNTKIDSAVITWPDRTTSTLIAPQVNKLHIADQSALKSLPEKNKATTTAVATTFTMQASSFEKHQENNYVDFYNERLVPRAFSREGPKAASADVNGDGLADIFIGAAEGGTGQLYLQTADGRFVKREEAAFHQPYRYEDVAVQFFDCDKDGDMDLLVCPGGNNHLTDSPELKLRLFKNDGKGNFTLDDAVLPATGMNIAVAIAHDFNNDGFEDLFIGGRSFPGVYGKDPQSFLLLNDGKGHFTDIAATKNPDISHIGMVTGAVWADILGDKQQELIIVGEWMAPRVFSFNKDHFDEVKTDLGEKYGWYQSIATADVNNDGKEDIILGNIGLNFYLDPAADRPAKLWMNDFDKNGEIDKMMTYTIDGKDMPVFLKRDVQEQIPGLKKQNLKHSDYANKSIQELFPPELIRSAIVKLFNYAPSCVAINNGNGKFSVKELPVTVQLSCINAIQPLDINGDGFIDLVTGGNQFGFLPQFEKLDGSFGEVMINDGKGNFVCQESGKNGLNLRGELRDIISIKNAQGTYLLFLQNNELPLYFKLNNPPEKK